jgi:hypothetical protein
MKNLPVQFASALILSCLIHASSRGETAQDTIPPTQPAAATNESSAPSDKVLKGGVRGAALLTEDGLMKLGETTAELQRTSEQVMAEVTRKENIVVRGPNVLPNGVVIPAFPGPGGMIAFGDLPPRKKQLNNFVSNLAYYVELLQNEVNALIIPDDKSAAISPYWDAIRKDMDEINVRFAALKELTAGPRYENLKIGKEALKLYDRAKEIDQLRREVMKIVATK